MSQARNPAQSPFPDASADTESASDAESAGDAALRAALRFIAYRPRSVAEVSKRLSPAFAPAVVDHTIDLCRRCGYLDDADFAGRWTESRLRRKPRGTALLRRELRQKGIAEDLIAHSLAEVDDQDNAYRAGCRRAELWLHRDAMAYPLFRRRMFAYLQRRGFSGSVCAQTTGQLWQDFAPANADADSDANAA